MRLRAAKGFLAYLGERKENEATAELLSLPGFEDAFWWVFTQAEQCRVPSLLGVFPDGSQSLGQSSQDPSCSR
jgi:hypothetical protein